MCVPSGGIMSATYSSLQSFNTPLGSIRGQTDVTVTFVCCSQHLWTLDQQKNTQCLCNHRKQQSSFGRTVDLEFNYLFNFSTLLINYCMIAVGKIPIQECVADSNNSERRKRQTQKQVTTTECRRWDIAKYYNCPDVRGIYRSLLCVTCYWGFSPHLAIITLGLIC